MKLSGEALAGAQGHGINPPEIRKVAEEIKEVHDLGVEIAIVVGGGNMWRGEAGAQMGMERAQADYIGMLGTVMNALALQDNLETIGVPTRVQTSIEMRQIAEPYIRRKADSHLRKGRVVIFGGGTGNPYFTTDTTASLRANELNCDAILMAKHGVEGVYSSDPKKNKDAKFFSKLTYKEMIQKDLSVMDTTAASLCMNTKIEIRVFNMENLDNFEKIINGEMVGTIITNEGE